MREVNMKLVFASDSFKGSLSSSQIAEILTETARDVFGACTCVGVPIADGGEGTVDAILAAVGGRRVTVPAHDPLMRKIEASYAVIGGGRAVIEMAEASGLTLVEEGLRDPMKTTSYGTGELIRHALHNGCGEITVAIGGSATNDGGTGCLTALGARFYNGRGEELGGCGGDLMKIARIDLSGLDPLVKMSRITVMCDVKNPLCGRDGATYVFGRQKGADDAALDRLEAGMRNYRDVIRRELDVDCDAITGAGAAGGLGAALAVFCGGKMQSGIETTLDLIDFDALLEGADLVITGEGRADRQSVLGKVVQGVGMRAKAKGVPVAALCGSVGEGAAELYQYGIRALISVTDESMTLEYAMENAEALYLRAAVTMFRDIKDGKILVP
jgi:glycerate kinase